MNARLIKLWVDLQSSYYFIPALMAIGAIILAFITSNIDKNLDFEAIQKLGWFYSNSADGARAILSTIAGSMITVAGVTFSMTMVAVTSAAAQYGPRLIGNFMRDKANQFTLGTFTSTFVYCLLIMRVARIGDSAGVENGVTEIIPNVSLMVALAMTLVSVGVLIYFIHHIPETLNVGNITSRVGREMRDNIDELFPHDMGDSYDEPIFDGDAYPLNKAFFVKARAEGYIQALDNEALMRISKEHDLVVRLQFRPGDFCVLGTELAHAWKSEPITQQQEQEISKKLRSCFALGRERTAYQNILFLADELVEILARALSPGINDPYTAINCMNWYHSALNAVSQGRPPSAFRYDENEVLRVIAYPVTFEEMLGVLCDQSRPYIAGDRNATLHMISVLTELGANTRIAYHKKLFLTQLEKLSKAAQSQLPSDIDRVDIAARYKSAKKLISDPEAYAAKQNEPMSIVGGRG